MFKDGRQRLDDLAGMAGGAFSLLSGLRAEMEAMAKAQVEAMVRKLDLARTEDLEAAMEVARRARAHADALEIRLAALEAEVAALKGGEPAPQEPSAG
ncbi:accessory factor UbiK family protein [Roseococcus sp. SYP-B2431]|uniref:accessory factor UbiK family protein n=1 Tax=Roseococcus sp. SYP-B2431 TaxID=2496640 RepID=UPI00103952A8|nr:accessory factor UbiK family protein [Roseococcus sp. SYP-B2431]TCI00289.1 accessory factor UbiK family protein [Roseococcus sp. SYP-B2431]